MLFILEISMFIGGIYALIAAKVPSFLVGSGKYPIEGKNARWVGVLLMLPLPIVFLVGLFAGMLFGEQGTPYVGIFELVIVIGTAILAMILTRIIGKRG